MQVELIPTAPLCAMEVEEEEKGNNAATASSLLLTDLPGHLLARVASSLEPRDASRFSQVCHGVEQATRAVRMEQMHLKMSQLRKDCQGAEERARKAEGLISRQAPVVELVTRVQ